MTDRTLRTLDDLARVDFEKADGLVPVIVQDDASGDVLMLAYADRSALEATLEKGQLHFHSRSRNQLWRKGETSGNTLALTELAADCDGDAVLARAVPAGPTCHTGERSCFGESAAKTAPTGPRGADPHVIDRLGRTLVERAGERPQGSYTVRLLDDQNLRLKKLGEETAELVAALATGDRTRALEEAADLVYHVLVALQAEGVGVPDLVAELGRREG